MRFFVVVCPRNLPAVASLHSMMQNYSQPKNHVIQSKNCLELVSKNMSSQFQLLKFPELIFISTQRCQLGTGAPSGWVCLTQCAALSKTLEIVSCLAALSTKTLKNVAFLVAQSTNPWKMKHKEKPPEGKYKK